MKKQWLKQMTIPFLLMVLQYLTFYPLLIAIGLEIFAPSVVCYLWLLPLCSWMGFGLCLFMKKVPIILIRSILISISLLLSFGLFQTMEQIIASTITLTIFFALPSYQKKGLFNQKTELSNTLLISGIILYLLVGLYGKFAQMQQLQHLLMMPSILFLIGSLFLSNYHTIQNAVQREGKKPTISKAVIRQNQIMVAGIVGVVLLIAGFNWLKNLLVGIIQQIKTAIIGLINWLSSLFDQEQIIEEAVPDGAKPDMGLLPTEEPALFWVILEKIMFVVIAIVMVFLIYLFIKKSVPKIINWLKKLISERQSFKINQSSFDYSEEQESTFRGNKIVASLKQAWSKRRDKRFNERWTDAKNEQEKARFLYRYYLYQQVKKGTKLKLSETPKEILMQDDNDDTAETKLELEEVYEQARYGKAIEKSERQLHALKMNIMNGIK